MTRYAYTLVTVALLLALPLVSPVHSSAQASPSQLTPDNTVVLANQVDTRFGRDFSVLLKHLRLEWVVLEGAAVPQAVQDKDLILLGRLDAPYTGEIMRELMTADEIDSVRAAADQSAVIEKASPWMEGRRLILCVGSDLLATRNAAETAIRDLMARSPPASAWIRTAFDAPLDDALRERVERLRFTWDDAELPLADLTVDLNAKPQRRVSAAQAAEDVERLFYLFAHGYAGYAFFNQDGAFEGARTGILETLAGRSTWSSEDLARLFHEQLGFITDCHLKIGDYPYAGHADFWYDTGRELVLGEGGYQFTAQGVLYTVVSIDGQDPEAFVYPSLNAQGDPVYRLGTLSAVEPAPLLLVAASDRGERRFEVPLRRSDYAYYANSYFREDEIGGIPVLRVRSFSDRHADALEAFVATGSTYRGAPAVIVDARGNGGGNEAWPIRWIQGLTGQRAEAVFVTSELHGKTTMAGRANVFAYMYDRYPGTDLYRTEAERHRGIAERYESGSSQPSWTAPRYPQLSLIPNDTTVIIVMNDGVASAGEGLVMRASRAENVVLVGENTMGCLTFGNAGVYQLPHSKLMAHLPINFGVYLDMTFRESQGLAPDLWVPAADAVNYTVAAVRSGTITTRQPLSSATLEQPFVPEDPWFRIRVVIALFVAAGSIWAFFMRKRPRLVAAVGGVWLVIGGVWIARGNPIGYGFLLASAIYLVWSGINLWRGRRAAVQDAA